MSEKFDSSLIDASETGESLSMVDKRRVKGLSGKIFCHDFAPTIKPAESMQWFTRSDRRDDPLAVIVNATLYSVYSDGPEYIPGAEVPCYLVGINNGEVPKETLRLVDRVFRGELKTSEAIRQAKIFSSAYGSLNNALNWMKDGWSMREIKEKPGMFTKDSHGGMTMDTAEGSAHTDESIAISKRLKVQLPAIQPQVLTLCREMENLTEEQLFALGKTLGNDEILPSVSTLYGKQVGYSPKEGSERIRLAIQEMKSETCDPHEIVASVRKAMEAVEK